MPPPNEITPKKPRHSRPGSPEGETKRARSSRWHELLAGERRGATPTNDMTNTKLNTSEVRAEPAASKQHRLIKLGLDVHADTIVVVRTRGHTALQPAQRFTWAKFRAWMKTQITLADTVHSCYEAGPSATACTGRSSRWACRTWWCSPSAWTSATPASTTTRATPRNWPCAWTATWPATPMWEASADCPWECCGCMAMLQNRPKARPPIARLKKRSPIVGYRPTRMRRTSPR